MRSQNYSAQRFRAGLAAFVVGRVTQAFTTFLLLLLAVRWLPLPDYGAYMLVWALCDFAVPITSLGLLHALQQFLPRLAVQAGRQRVRQFVRAMELARLLLTALVIGVSLAAWSVLAPAVGLRVLVGWQNGLLVAALVVVVLGARYVAEILECLLEQRDAQIVRALQPVARLAGLVLLWLLDRLTLANLLWLDLLVTALLFAWGQWLLARRLRALPPEGDMPVPWAEVRTFVGHLSLSQCLSALGDAAAIRLVAGRVLGLEATGVFAFLQQLTVTAHRYLPSILLANVVRPMLVVRHASGDLETVGCGVALLWKLNLVLMCAAVAAVGAGGDGLLALLSGGAVQSGGLPMTLLLLGLLGTAMSMIAAMALQIHGRADLVGLISVVAPLTLLFAWAGGRAYGLLGLAIGVAVSMWLRAVAVMVVAQQRERKAPLDWAGALQLLGLTVIVAMVGHLAGRIAGPVAATVLAAALFAGLLRWMRPLRADESALIARALGPRARWISGWSRAE